MIIDYALLTLLGVAVGVFGTLIGAGGGFILMPVLLLLYPGANPEWLTSISLAVVFANALSGSVAYGRMKRIDYRSGLWFSAAAVPGAILGALSTAYIPRHWFDLIFGLLMLAAAAFLLISPEKRTVHAATAGEARGGTRAQYHLTVGIVLSLFVGFVSSVLGIGGGIIHVPALVHILGFAVHTATATSHFILAIMAFAGTVVHIVEGNFTQGFDQTIALCVGALIGAQGGARLSTRVRSEWIIRVLGLALGFVGLRLLLLFF